MSNPLAIAATTAALQTLLKAATTTPLGGKVTAKPLSNARLNEKGAQLNLCLYHTAIDATLRNNPDALHRPPARAADGSLIVPLPLNLYYLITAFAEAGQNAEIVSHVLLGHAMAILHDHPLLSAAELEAAANGLNMAIPGLGASTLHQQVERVRITPQPLSDEEMMKLWTAAQTGYSPSFAYQVSVVVIESTRPGTMPLPVLRRGAEDRGPKVIAGGFGPALFEMKLPNRQSAAFAGNIVTLEGSGFSSDPAAVGPVSVRFAPAGGGDAILLDAEADSSTEKVEVTIDPAKLAADIYSVSVVVQRGESDKKQTWKSNALPLAIAPKIEQLRLDGAFQVIANVDPDTPLSVQRDASKKVTVGVVCVPTVIAEDDPNASGKKRFKRPVRLLFANATEIEPSLPTVTGAIGTVGTPLIFNFPVSDDDLDISKDPDGNVKSLRLRVNGVELPTIVRGKQGLQFGTRVRILK